MRYFYMEDGVLTEYLGVIKSNAEMAGYAKYEGTKSVDWLKLDEEGKIQELTPEEYEIRDGQPDVTGKLCVIGSKLEEDKIAALFRV